VACVEFWGGQAGVAAEFDHALGGGTGLLDVAGEVKRLGDQRIGRDRRMVGAQVVEGERAGVFGLRSSSCMTD
jgi:hypothetical protein